MRERTHYTMEERVKYLKERLKNKGVGAFLVASPLLAEYLLNIYPPLIGMPLITKTDAFFITDFCHFEEAERRISGWQILEKKGDFFPFLGRILKKERVRNLGFDPASLTFGHYQKLKALEGIGLVPLKGLDALCQIKNKEEIKNIKKAAEITSLAFAYLLKIIKPEMEEKRLAVELEYFLGKKGAEPGFSPIIASGVRSSLPHGLASEKRIKKGEVILIDFGARYKGYNADFSRTIMLGKAGKKEREIYQLVLKAQDRALQKIKAGVEARAIDAQARLDIDSQGYGKYFGHGLGHGIGRAVHESPNINRKNKAKLQENMVISVEPGIYLPGMFGIRIEDSVLITQGGCELLTMGAKRLEI